MNWLGGSALLVGRRVIFSGFVLIVVWGWGVIWGAASVFNMSGFAEYHAHQGLLIFLELFP